MYNDKKRYFRVGTVSLIWANLKTSSIALHTNDSVYVIHLLHINKKNNNNNL